MRPPLVSRYLCALCSRPTSEARVTDNPVAMRILAAFGWTEETAYADWDTMLAHLPRRPRRGSMPKPNRPKTRLRDRKAHSRQIHQTPRRNIHRQMN
ncbi:hypothetical protein MPC4_110047 [Methylocella tundrae]|uniref:Uncharacterized protein n=1 Tax=Methylocella tundrae TaxID=227605 RepID=A0A8B6M137_METTU|nr:hypothetical protein MPC1_6200002 [Methylocella tundrae]VTZ48747.1 hypothetical protein MPC4_110047 [Methylocella tundrae]